MTIPLCYLRPLRREWGLSQEELAALLGFQSPQHVSRIEQGRRVPTLDTALALEALFGVPPKELFPALTQEASEQMLRHAAALFDAINDDPSLRGRRKRELLAKALTRTVISSNPPPNV